MRKYCLQNIRLDLNEVTPEKQTYPSSAGPARSPRRHSKCGAGRVAHSVSSERSSQLTSFRLPIPDQHLQKRVAEFHFLNSLAHDAFTHGPAGGSGRI